MNWIRFPPDQETALKQGLGSAKMSQRRRQVQNWDPWHLQALPRRTDTWSQLCASPQGILEAKALGCHCSLGAASGLSTPSAAGVLSFPPQQRARADGQQVGAAAAQGTAGSGWVLPPNWGSTHPGSPGGHHYGEDWQPVQLRAHRQLTPWLQEVGRLCGEKGSGPTPLYSPPGKKSWSSTCTASSPPRGTPPPQREGPGPPQIRGHLACQQLSPWLQETWAGSVGKKRNWALHHFCRQPASPTPEGQAVKRLPCYK